jgi:2-iminobutanoate/2-iminopropanoate deaminase
MTDRRHISTEAAPAAIGPYSQAVWQDGWLWCSGQIALDPATKQIVSGGTAAETTRVLDNLAAVLHAAGLEFRHVVKTTIYLVDMADFTAVNEIYGRCFGPHRPARATVQVAALPRGARVEIDCVAKA